MYRAIMKEIGYLKKSDLADSVRLFGEDINDAMTALRDDISTSKDEVNRLKSKLKDLKARSKQESDKELKQEVAEEIDDLQADVKCSQEELEEYKAEYAALKNDKRVFLIDYINHELHGQDRSDSK